MPTTARPVYRSLGIADMPKLDVKVLALISPLVNVDLFKKGLYHVRCRVMDVPSNAGPFGTPFVTLCRIMDSPNGVGLKGAYPRAFVIDDKSAVTKTVFVQYIQQNHVLSDWFAFDVSIPLLEIPDIESQSLTSLELALDLYLCETEKTFNVSPKDFTLVSSRTVVVSLNRYGSIHEYTDAMFDFVYMAAVGVNIHAAVVGFDTSDVGIPCTSQPSQQTSWFSNIFKSRQPPDLPSFPSFSQLLFDSPAMEPKSRSAVYEIVPTRQLVKACERFERVWTILRQSYVTLKEILQDVISYRTGGKRNRTRSSIADDFPVRESLANFTAIEDFTHCCERQLLQADEITRHIWSKFIIERVANQGLLESFVYVSHRKRISSMLNTTVLLPRPIENSKFDFSLRAQETREGLEMHYGLWCRENTEESSKASIVFVEHLRWNKMGTTNPVNGGIHDTTVNGKDVQGSLADHYDQFTNIHSKVFSSSSLEFAPPQDSVPESKLVLSIPEESNSLSQQVSLLSPATPDHSSFSDCTFPYLLCSITGATGRDPSSEVHLVVFVHGLEGRHFDLRLYKIYLELALPQVTFDFLLCKSTEGFTFCDFELMTDRAVEEFLQHVHSSMVQPTRISFIGHSLGSVVVRNMLTRPKMAAFLPKMHTLISLCAPHLGTSHTSSHISLGMWFLQKWHHSQSLLQLSMKDHPNLQETFLYRLSQKTTFGYFQNVLLVSSPQDKYVPFYSARLEVPTEDRNSVCSLMLDNILEHTKERKTNIVRFTVDHLLDSSTNSLIGRAAHIAKLEDVRFVEKFVVLHCTKYFV